MRYFLPSPLFTEEWALLIFKGIEVCAQGLSHYVVAIETVRTRWLTLGCGG
jgi:hypothetical protein